MNFDEYKQHIWQANKYFSFVFKYSKRTCPVIVECTKQPFYYTWWMWETNAPTFERVSAAWLCLSEQFEQCVKSFHSNCETRRWTFMTFMAEDNAQFEVFGSQVNVTQNEKDSISAIRPLIMQSRCTKFLSFNPVMTWGGTLWVVLKQVYRMFNAQCLSLDVT